MTNIECIQNKHMREREQSTARKKLLPDLTKIIRIADPLIYKTWAPSKLCGAWYTKKWKTKREVRKLGGGGDYSTVCASSIVYSFYVYSAAENYFFMTLSSKSSHCGSGWISQTFIHHWGFLKINSLTIFISQHLIRVIFSPFVQNIIFRS